MQGKTNIMFSCSVLLVSFISVPSKRPQKTATAAYLRLPCDDNTVSELLPWTGDLPFLTVFEKDETAGLASYAASCVLSNIKPLSRRVTKSRACIRF